MKSKRQQATLRLKPPMRAKFLCCRISGSILLTYVKYIPGPLFVHTYTRSAASAETLKQPFNPPPSPHCYNLYLYLYKGVFLCCHTNPHALFTKQIGHRPLRPASSSLVPSLFFSRRLLCTFRPDTPSILPLSPLFLP